MVKVLIIFYIVLKVLNYTVVWIYDSELLLDLHKIK